MKHDAEYVRIRLRGLAAVSGGQRALARKIGCSTTFLNEVVRGLKEPSGPVLDYLGLERRLIYVAKR